MEPPPDIPPIRRRKSLRAGDAARERARQLRASMSKPEVFLWTSLMRRRTGFLFRRQKPLGPFIADFYCHEALLVIEVDGGSHGSRGEENRARDRWMRERGVEVLRILARDVLADLNGAAERVAGACKRRMEMLEIAKALANKDPVPGGRRPSPDLEDSTTPSGSPEGDQ